MWWLSKGFDDDDNDDDDEDVDYGEEEEEIMHKPSFAVVNFMR
jgi:hypothetical protein